jgi:hypothetical protein
VTARKVFIFVLAAFWTLWMNVLLPGHTRGLITVAGYQEGAAAKACCMDEEGAGEKKSQGPSKERVANCALCAFAAHLTTPPVLDLVARPGDLLCLLPEPRVEGVTTLELVLAYMERGPPEV